MTLLKNSYEIFTQCSSLNFVLVIIFTTSYSSENNFNIATPDLRAIAIQLECSQGTPSYYEL